MTVRQPIRSQLRSSSGWVGLAGLVVVALMVTSCGQRAETEPAPVSLVAEPTTTAVSSPSTSANAGGTGATVTGVQASSTPSLVQVAFRIRDDSFELGADAGWLGALNQDVTVPAETTFRIRVEIEEANGAGIESAFLLQYRHSGGVWTDLPTTRPLDERDRSETQGVESWPTSEFAVGAPTDDLLAGSDRAFVPGSATAAPSNTAESVFLQGQHTELEWSVRIHKFFDGPASNHEGASFEFRVVRADGTPLDAYAAAPMLTLDWPDGLVGGTYVESPHRLGPFRDTNGNLYFPVEYTETDAEWAMLKSEDGGKTWTPVDEIGAPSSGDLESVDIQQVGDTLHILHTGGSTASLDVHYYTFAMSDHPAAPDAWGLDELVAGDFAAGDQSSSLVVLADGRVRAFFRYEDRGTDRIGYRTRTVDGSWETITTEIDSVAADFTDVVAVPSAARRDLVHVFYNDNANGMLYHRTLDGEGRLTDRVLIASGTGTEGEDEQPIVPPVTWNDGADMVLVGYWSESSGRRLRAAVLRDGVVVSDRRWSDVVPAQDRGTSSQPVADLAGDGGTVYGLFADAGQPDQVYADLNAGDTSWGTDVAQFTNPYDDYGWIRGNVFTHAERNGGARVYGFVYDTGNEAARVGYGTGYIHYRELTLPFGTG